MELTDLKSNKKAARVCCICEKCDLKDEKEMHERKTTRRRESWTIDVLQEISRVRHIQESKMLLNVHKTPNAQVKATYNNRQQQRQHKTKENSRDYDPPAKATKPKQQDIRIPKNRKHGNAKKNILSTGRNG